MSWKNLEQDIFELLKEDKPVLPKGSGSSKGEEDVVSENIIVQCKYTDHINMSILKKDLDRLDTASNLLQKFPLFINANQNNQIISIPYNDKTKSIIKIFIYFIRLHNNLFTLTTYVKTKNKDLGMLKIFSSILKNSKSLLYKITNYFKSSVDQVEQQLDQKYIDLTVCDLFDETNNN